MSPKHPPVADPSGHAGHQGVVAHPVEEPVEIDIDDPGLARLDRPPGGFDRLVGAPPRPEAEAPVRERGFEDGAEDLAQRLLEEAIEHRRHAQLALPATGLGDRHPADGAGRYVPSSSDRRISGQAAFR